MKVSVKKCLVTGALAVGLLQVTPLLAFQETQAPSQDPSGQSKQSEEKKFTGKIEKSGDKLILKADKASYDLDDQEKAKSFEGKDVKVTGTLDASTNTIHVSNIEPAS